jgi:plasmid replication initiation protein
MIPAKEFEVLVSENHGIVALDNRLAGLAEELSLNEKRIVATALLSADFKSSSRWGVKIQALDYAEMFGLDPNTTYDQLEMASYRLRERRVRWEDKAPSGKSRDNVALYLSSTRYIQDDGVVELTFVPEIAEHFTRLHSHYTSSRFLRAPQDAQMAIVSDARESIRLQHKT